MSRFRQSKLVAVWLAQGGQSRGNRRGNSGIEEVTGLEWCGGDKWSGGSKFHAGKQDIGATLTAGRGCEAASEARAVGGAALIPRLARLHASANDAIIRSSLREHNATKLRPHPLTPLPGSPARRLLGASKAFFAVSRRPFVHSHSVFVLPGGEA